MAFLLLSAPKNLQVIGSMKDPKGGAQDVRRFSTEPWMASRKILITMNLWDCFVGESVFLWFVSFDAYQKK